MLSQSRASSWGRLAEFTRANSVGVRNPYAVLSARLSPVELPAMLGSPSSRPPSCGQCHRESRFLLDELGYPSAVPCPRCRRGEAKRGQATIPRASGSEQMPPDVETVRVSRSSAR